MSDKKVEEKYEGEYKFEVSDKGRIRIDINYKWLVSILITVIGFIMYLVIDKYHIQPINDLIEKNAKLEEKDKLTDVALKTLVENQKILLDRSERVEQWMVNNMPTLRDMDDNEPTPVLEETESSAPGSSNNSNEEGPSSDSTEDPRDFANLDNG